MASEGMSPEARLALIRGLGSEVAVSKVPLPRGKQGVFVDSQGKLDEARAKQELRQNGVAISPGMPVEITRIAFKSNRILFELNGGGRKKKKWYQHIEVGVGTTAQPIVPQTSDLAYGSSVSLVFHGKMPGLTVEQAKSLLATVLDFSRHSPTSLYSPAVPPQFKEAIQKHQAMVGMDRDAVLSAKGPPDRKVREVREGVEQEDWIYGLPPHVLFVTFEGDTVVALHQY
jgi:hypothetical protein